MVTNMENKWHKKVSELQFLMCYLDLFVCVCVYVSTQQAATKLLLSWRVCFLSFKHHTYIDTGFWLYDRFFISSYSLKDTKAWKSTFIVSSADKAGLHLCGEIPLKKQFTIRLK